MTATYKDAQDQGIAPWDDLDYEENGFYVFNDKYPVTPGHKLFVPKVNNDDAIALCFTKARRYGEWLVLSNQADGYNIGINGLEAGGQTVMYPHVHMIPRRNGDCEDPVGGVRNVVPGRGNYRKW
jgi:diadenosine tetraphosphate (Ap4A) HIT family hydrolase